MATPYFERHLKSIESQLNLGETTDDIETMHSIIVNARRERKSRGEEDERIALWSLCFLGIPLKAAQYADEVRQFRGRFTGISVEASLQKQFRGAIKRPLLEADKAEDLSAEKLSDIFDDKAGGHEPFNPGGRGGKTGPGATLEDWPGMKLGQTSEEKMKAVRYGSPATAEA